MGIKVVEAAAIPCDDIPRKTSNKTIFEFWDKMTGAFFTYVGTDATGGCNPKGNRLSRNTADGYCSSAKGHFTDKFRIQLPIPVFQQQQCSKLRDKLKGLHREDNRAKGKPAFEGRTPSARQDCKAMSTACVWLGTPQFAEFWQLLNTSCHCSGRGSEASLITSKGTRTVEVNELTCNCEVLAVDLQRQKDVRFKPSQSVPIETGSLKTFISA